MEPEQISRAEAMRRRNIKRQRRRERRRKVMIARCCVAVVLLTVICGAGYGIFRVADHLLNPDNGKNQTEQVLVTPEPTSAYYVPEGMEQWAEKLEAMREEYPQVKDILINLKEYRESILNLAVTNLETLDFVLDYPRNKTIDEQTGEITDEELDQGIPQLQQWDKRWGYVNYGSDCIAISGCGPTCLSMVVSGLKQDKTVTPAYVAQFSLFHNYYSADYGSSWKLMSTGAEELGLKVHNDLSAGSARLAEKVVDVLRKGDPVIASMKPGDFTTAGHFIVLTGVTQDGKLLIHDPNSISRSSKQWEPQTVCSQIKAVWYYSLP